MSPWLETAGAAVVVALSALTARWLGRTRWWWSGYVVPLALVCLIAVIRRLQLDLSFPLLMDGRREFLVLGGTIAMLLVTPASRLPNPRDRRAVLALAFVAATYAGVYPFMSVALVRPQVLGFQTRVTSDGVCMQSANYTCGPASAVTVLRRLGLPAEERELALDAKTCPATGTSLEDLRAVMLERYASQGLSCDIVKFRSLAEMPANSLVVVKLGLFVDHWVAVLEVDGRQVVIGDPLEGRRVYTHEKFLRRWRGMGLVVRRL